MRFHFLTLAFCLTAACSTQPKSGASHEPKEPHAAEKNPPHASKPADKGPDKASESAAASATKTECSTKGDTRILELRAKGKGCELAYTKNGQEGIVASAANGSSYCENAMNKIRERLKGSGFECK